MKKRGMILAGLVVSILLATGVCRAADAKLGPSAVAGEYFSMWIAGRTCEGVVKHWDIDRSLADLFAGDYSGLSLSDRIYLQRIFNVFMVASNRSPSVRASLKGATIKLADPEKRPENRIRISGDLTTKRGLQKVFVELVRIDGSWKIVNLGHSGRGMEALAAVWIRYKAAVPKGSVALPGWFEMILTQVLSASRPRSAGSERPTGGRAKPPADGAVQKRARKELPGYWAVKRVTKDGKVQGGNMDTYLHIRPDGTFRTAGRGKKTQGLWRVDVDGKAVFSVGDKAIMQSVWSRDGDRLTLSFEDRGARVEIKYAKAKPPAGPKTPDEK